MANQQLRGELQQAMAREPEMKQRIADLTQKVISLEEQQQDKSGSRGWSDPKGGKGQSGSSRRWAENRNTSGQWRSDRPAASGREGQPAWSSGQTGPPGLAPKQA